MSSSESLAYSSWLPFLTAWIRSIISPLLQASTAPARALMNTPYLAWLCLMTTASQRCSQCRMSSLTTVPFCTQSPNRFSRKDEPLALKQCQFSICSTYLFNIKLRTNFIRVRGCVTTYRQQFLFAYMTVGAGARARSNRAIRPLAIRL